MLIKTTNLTEQQKAWVIAGVLGVDVDCDAGRINPVHLADNGGWFNPSSPEIILALMKQGINITSDVYGDWYIATDWENTVKVEVMIGENGDGFEEAILSCALQAQGEYVDVPSELVEVSDELVPLDALVKHAQELNMGYDKENNDATSN